MNDEIKRRLLSGEPIKGIIDDVLRDALKASSEFQAALEEDRCAEEEWVDRVLYGDPDADDGPKGVIRAGRTEWT